MSLKRENNEMYRATTAPNKKQRNSHCATVGTIQTENDWDRIPAEVKWIILAKLPPRGISIWQYVCKEWRTFSKSNSFWKQVQREHGNIYGQVLIPDRVFEDANAAELLRAIFLRHLLSRNYIRNEPGSDIKMDWILDSKVTYRAESDPKKRVFVIPPGSCIYQTVILQQHGVCPWFLEQIGSIQFIATARFSYPPGINSGAEMFWLGLSQISNKRMIRFDRLSNIMSDTQGWKRAQIILETEGSSFKAAESNALILHIANVKSFHNSNAAIEVADISLVLLVVQENTSKIPKPDIGYGFHQDTFRPFLVL